MKKTKKRLLLTAVTAAVACTVTSGVALTSFASEDTKDHEFNTRQDQVFEDFDRESLTGVTTSTADLTDLGVKPYLHVELEERTSADNGVRNEQIYKHGHGALGELNNADGNDGVIIEMRGDVDFSNLYFAVHAVGAYDNENDPVVKSFADLKFVNDLDDEDSLTSEWVSYEISFVNTYNNDDTFGGDPSNDKVLGDTAIAGIHIFADPSVTDKYVDINSVSVRIGTETTVLNDFTGGNTVTATAAAGTWWAGPNNADGDGNGRKKVEIVKRQPRLSVGGDLKVVKAEAVGDYKYAIVETSGNASGLKYQTTSDGTTLSEKKAYDGYSIELNGDEKGFVFTNEGDETVIIKRIYLTNNITAEPDVAPPIVDAKTARFFEDFEIDHPEFALGYQTSLEGCDEFEEAGVYYRLSNAHNDKVKIEDGVLELDGDGLDVEDNMDYINYKFKSKGTFNQNLLVFKMKSVGDDDDSLKGFSITLYDDVGEGAAIGGERNAKEWKSGLEYGSKLLDDSNPYKTDDGWYYVIIDLAETFGKTDQNIAAMDMYYRKSNNKLVIDEIFFAEKVEDTIVVAKTTTFGEEKVLAATTAYAPEYFGGCNYDGAANTTLCFDVTPEDDDFDISNLRIQFQKGDNYSTVFWASENVEGTLITRDGKKLNELTYEKGKATHIEIDLEASGITGAFEHIHSHRDNIGAFTVSNFALKTYDSIFAITVRDEDNALTFTNELTAQREDGDIAEYRGLGSVEGFESAAYDWLEFTITPGADFDPSTLRLGFGEPAIWFNNASTIDGTKVMDLNFVEGEPVKIVFDLKKNGIDVPFGGIWLHSNLPVEGVNVSSGAFTMSGFKLGNFVAYGSAGAEYAKQMALFDTYTATDDQAPMVNIYTATDALVGDVITVEFDAVDNKTTASDILSNPERITVIVKDPNGDDVTVGSDYKFTASAVGKYTVTVEIEDEAGNVGTKTIQITVTEPGTTTPDNPNNPGTTEPGAADSGKKLSGGAIAGIVIGCVAGVGLIAVGAFFLVKYLRKKKGSKGDDAKNDKKEDENKD